MTRVPLPKNQNRADDDIPRTSLPNLWHPARAIAPPLLKHQKSTINVSRESDIVQVLHIPKTGGDHNVLQTQVGGDHSVPKYKKVTIEVAKQHMEANVFTKTPWPVISDEKYSMVVKACQLAIEVQDS